MFHELLSILMARTKKTTNTKVKLSASDMKLIENVLEFQELVHRCTDLWNHSEQQHLMDTYNRFANLVLPWEHNQLIDSWSKHNINTEDTDIDMVCETIVARIKLSQYV